MMPAAFRRFVEATPLCTMARVCLEALYEPKSLDALFHSVRERQYTKEVLFSDIVDLMNSVVLRLQPSVHAAYKARAADLSVSDQAIYDKLQHMELGVSAALVAHSAARITPIIKALGTEQQPWLRGWNTHVIDGNHLSASERRLKVLQHTWAAALPGKVLAIYEPNVDLVTEVFLTPDGHAQERSLLDEVLATIRRKDLWIADRNFCTLKFLFGIADRKAAFVIRQHGTLQGKLLAKRRPRGRCETGKLYEQRVELVHGEQTLIVRRITLVLDTPSTDGDTEIHVFTNLSRQDASAAKVAELYRKRWTIEGRFYEVTQTLNCEPNTLAYPKAALFAFCLALMASNAVALMRASLRAVHSEEEVRNMSAYYMALEIQQTYAGMMVALPPEKWTPFAALAPDELADVLRDLARHVDVARYRKAKRGPKKPPPKKGRYQNGRHVSTHKLLRAAEGKS